jgi:hypothetical protein
MGEMATEIRSGKKRRTLIYLAYPGRPEKSPKKSL